MSTRPASLHDVAKRAGVSISTVPRFLNGQLPLRPETETRILDAIDTVGYVKPRTRVRAALEAPAGGPIGLVVPQIGNTYFGGIADAVVAAADRQGFTVLLTSHAE
ncbi:LacI family DNA-binding transcriptional regulator [Streptomyces sp. L7]